MTTVAAWVLAWLGSGKRGVVFDELAVLIEQECQASREHLRFKLGVAECTAARF
jgi:hypothetical protein